VSFRAAAQANTEVTSKCATPEAEPRRLGEGSMDTRKLVETGMHSGGAGSDSTETRTCQATGEALLVPDEKSRKQGKPYNRRNGKWADDERVTDGFIVAKKAGNAAGAKEPCYS